VLRKQDLITTKNCQWFGKKHISEYLRFNKLSSKLHE
jgi:hypothetical protein